MKPVFFTNPTKFRSWLAVNHGKASQLLVGFHRVGSGKPSLTWPESVDEALCYGWIDGLRKGIDADSYTIRFSPRRPGSFWSKKNIASAKRLIRAGCMRAAGLKAFKARLGEKSGAYSFEQDEIPPFNAAMMKPFKAKKGAWDFFSAQPPGYQKTLRHWVLSAKQAETQLKRLDRIVDMSAQKRRVDLEAPFGKRKG